MGSNNKIETDTKTRNNKKGENFVMVYISIFKRESQFLRPSLLKVSLSFWDRNWGSEKSFSVLRLRLTLTLILGYELFSGANLFETSPYMSRLRPRVLMIFNKWGHQCSKFKNKLSNMPGHAIFLKDCMKNCVRLARNKSKSKTLTDTKESSFLRTFQR